ncbi:Asp23/Gls24 family envelope stress response protein [Anaerovorax odorimutans]|uniref:Asp23/Gls24 family envelope stress response protein n=1 Tax=Anaerovorax odorimutans TaxID=109327 RepID=UPI000408BD17|nr:Asp23/Gls24 family envelope stress response protein [Anaerovorax odorimutans]
MFYKIETSDGNISIEKVVVGRIITQTVDSFHGKVLLSNHKGKSRGIVAKIGGIDDINYMDIELGEEGLDIKIYVVIKFGTSIKTVTKLLIQEIKKNIEEYASIKVNSVSIIVAGMVSKQIARRNIEVKG